MVICSTLGQQRNNWTLLPDKYSSFNISPYAAKQHKLFILRYRISFQSDDASDS